MGILQPHERHRGQARRNALGQTGTKTAFVVHSPRHAVAALRAGEATGIPIVLASPQGAGGSLGAPWFLEVLAAAAEAVPKAAFTAALDCGDAPGHVQAALRAGVKTTVFSGPPATRRKLAAIAEALGAKVLAKLGSPRVLDLAGAEDPDAACEAFLRSFTPKPSKGK